MEVVKWHRKKFMTRNLKFRLGREIGFSKAAKEIGIHADTLYGWNKRAKDARLDLGPGSQYTSAYYREELLYGRYETQKMKIKELKTLI